MLSWTCGGDIPRGPESYPGTFLTFQAWRGKQIADSAKHEVPETKRSIETEVISQVRLARQKRPIRANAAYALSFAADHGDAEGQGVGVGHFSNIVRSSRLGGPTQYPRTGSPGTAPVSRVMGRHCRLRSLISDSA